MILVNLFYFYSCIEARYKELIEIYKYKRSK